MQRCMEVLHAHSQCLPTPDIVDSFVVMPAHEPWIVVSAQADHALAFLLGELPVVHRDMRDGSGAWLRRIAQNMAQARAR